MKTRFHEARSCKDKRVRILGLVLGLLLLSVLLSCILIPDQPDDTDPGLWIAQRADDLEECPEVEGWQTESLTDSSIDTSDKRAWRFGLCRYSPSAGARLADLEDQVGKTLKRLERDHRVIVPLATPDCSTGQNEKLEKLFLKQAGALSVQETPVLFPRQEPVRLVLFDTHPDDTWPLAKPSGTSCPSSPFSSPSSHGYDLAMMARALLCPETGDCPVEIATRLALTEPQGCYFMGSIGDLAQALVRELDSWRSQPKPPRLVLNLSVGWDPQYGTVKGNVDCGSSSGEGSLAAQSVYCSLKEATCSGALVLAAAGNRGGYGQSTGPVLPAGWELEQPFTQELCKDVLATVEKRDEPDDSLPYLGNGNGFGELVSASGTLQPAILSLVYAVGGVQAEGTSLVNSRPKAEPRRVAYGDHALLGSDMCPYTGSSVASVVAASAVVAAWWAEPAGFSAEVLRRVEASGDSMLSAPSKFRLAEFPPKPPAPPVRMLSVASAFRGRPSIHRGAEIADLTALQANGMSCSGVASLNLSSDPHPLTQYSTSLSPDRVKPSPQVVPCPPCTELTRDDTRLAASGDASADNSSSLDTGSRLLIRIHPEWSAGSLEEAWLETDSKLYSLTLKPSTASLAPGSCLLASLDGASGEAMSLLLKVRTKSGEYWVSDNPVFRRIAN